MDQHASNSDGIDILGMPIRFLTPFVGDSDGYCVIAAVVPAHVFVPLHSHRERETFVILSGTLEAFDGASWRTYGAGEVFDVARGAKHALRNTSNQPTSLLLVTTESMARFLQTVGRPVGDTPSGPPDDEAIQTFTMESIRHGYWLATPAENRAIGLPLLMPPPVDEFRH